MAFEDLTKGLEAWREVADEAKAAGARAAEARQADEDRRRREAAEREGGGS